MLSYSPKPFKIKLAHISKFASLFVDVSKKSPYSVVPSDRETSLTSFGMTHQDVLPRRVSAEGPLALLGATKKRARGDKKGLGATKSSLRTTAYPFLP